MPKRASREYILIKLIFAKLGGEIFSQISSGIILGATLAHRNRSDFCDLRLRCPSRTPEIAAISMTRQSNAALRFEGAMESR